MTLLSETPSPAPRTLPENVRVLLADEHPIVRFGLRKLLDPEGLIVVGEATKTSEVLPKVQELSPDILLLDRTMLYVDGCPTLTTIQIQHSHTRVIVTADTHDHAEFVEVVRMGARGIVLKQTAPELIVKSIRKVHDGEIWLDSQTTAAVMQRFSSGPVHPSGDYSTRERQRVTTREHEIIALVAQGHKNKEMADVLFISEQTVKNHLHNIFDKLQVSDRLELALYAVHNGLHLRPEVAAKIPPQKNDVRGRAFAQGTSS